MWDLRCIYMDPEQDVEKGPTTPALPQARQDAPLPGLCSRVAQSLNVPPTGKELVSASSGRAGEMVRLGFSLTAAALDGLFEHPARFLTVPAPDPNTTAGYAENGSRPF